MPSVLVVEDDATLQSALTQVLARAGYSVATAGNGAEALQVQKENPADVIVCDIVMPEKDGIETLMEMAKLKPKPRFIAISGGGRINASCYLKVASKLGADRVFNKPFTSGDLSLR